MVVKKNGIREPFDRAKIMNGIIRACQKRSVSTSTIEDVVAEIEKDIRNRVDHEVESAVVGEIVMDKLKDLDQVAYVRFASVYRQFTDLERFKQELEKLL
jgi:transcriptional repressor NrdR